MRPPGTPAEVAGRIPEEERRTVHTSAAGHILEDCTDRIVPEVAFLALVAPAVVDMAVLAVVVAVAREAFVAVAGLAGSVAAAVVTESAVLVEVLLVEVHLVAAAEAYLFDEAPSDVVAEKAVSVE